jgi:hypothetical protein
MRIYLFILISFLATITNTHAKSYELKELIKLAKIHPEIKPLAP